MFFRSRLLSSLVIDDHTIAVAWGSRPGVDLHA